MKKKTKEKNNQEGKEKRKRTGFLKIFTFDEYSVCCKIDHLVTWIIMFSFVLLFYFVIYFFLFCLLNFCVSLVPLKYMLTAQTHFIRSEYLGFYAVKKIKKKQQEKSNQEGKKKKRKRTGFLILSRFQNTQTVTQYTDYSTVFRILRRLLNILITQPVSEYSDAHIRFLFLVFISFLFSSSF